MPGARGSWTSPKCLTCQRLDRARAASPRSDDMQRLWCEKETRSGKTAKKRSWTWLVTTLPFITAAVETPHCSTVTAVCTELTHTHARTAALQRVQAQSIQQPMSAPPLTIYSVYSCVCVCVSLHWYPHILFIYMQVHEHSVSGRRDKGLLYFIPFACVWMNVCNCVCVLSVVYQTDRLFGREKWRQ